MLYLSDIELLRLSNLYRIKQVWKDSKIIYTFPEYTMEDIPKLREDERKRNGNLP